MQIHTRKIIPFLLGICLAAGCSSENNSGERVPGADSVAVADNTAAAPLAIVPDYDTAVATSAITDSVICKAHPTQSYALYLPSGYTKNKSFPIIIFFDAHARGGLPVYTYHHIAEKYGFILVGSNTSQNGIPWQVTQDMSKALMTDVRTRFNIDARRIYMAGFSGGARIAATIAITDSGIAGVIGAAAAFPKIQYELHNKFDYFGIAGYYDFNLTEMVQWDMIMAQNGYPHQLLTPVGKHDWPSTSDFEMAVLWLQVNAMKRGNATKNDTVIKTLKYHYDRRIAGALQASEFIAAYDLTTGAADVLNGLTDISAYTKQRADISANTGYVAARASQQQLQEQEQIIQQEIVKQFATQNEAMWSKTVADFNLQTRSADAQKSGMYRRLLHYLGFVAYMHTTQALASGDLAHAPIYLHTFKLADPQNPDVYYLEATFYMKKNDMKKAAEALNKAISNGFNNVALLITDPSFLPMHTQLYFNSIISRAKKNVHR